MLVVTLHQHQHASRGSVRCGAGHLRAELRVPAQAQGEEIESGLAPSHNLKIIYSRDLRKQNKGGGAMH